MSVLCLFCCLFLFLLCFLWVFVLLLFVSFADFRSSDA